MSSIAEIVLVLGGGNALGSYLAGAWETLEERGIEPDRVIGASAGAITGAILLGNPPELRLPRLREFWAEAKLPSAYAPFQDQKLREQYDGWHVAWSFLVGRPSIFQHRWPGLWSALPGAPRDVAVYDHAPLRATLKRLVDFDRLNGSATRFTICCVELETGEEVQFENGRDDIGPEHILASTAITPLFPPVRVGERLLCDPGYVNNTPVDLALVPPPDRNTLCIVAELFSVVGEAPSSLDAMLERSQDILFASTTRRTIAALQREYALRVALRPDAPAMTLLHFAYRAAGHELAGKTFDYSPSSVDERWEAGCRDAAAALDLLGRTRAAPGLTYLPVGPVPSRPPVVPVLDATQPERP